MDWVDDIIKMKGGDSPTFGGGSMIVQALLSVIFAVISMLLSVISLPQLPEGATNALNLVWDRLPEIFNIFFFFCDPTLVVILLGLVLVYHNVDHVYTFIMWVLKKFGMN